jgi:hypothetical protein
MINAENDNRSLGGLHAMDNDVRQARHHHFAGTLQCALMTDHGEIGQQAHRLANPLPDKTGCGGTSLSEIFGDSLKMSARLRCDS